MKTRIAVLALVLAFACTRGYSQSPYALSFERDLPILGGGAILFGVDVSLHKKFPALTPADTVGLSILDIPGHRPAGGEELVA